MTLGQRGLANDRRCQRIHLFDEGALPRQGYRRLVCRENFSMILLWLWPYLPRAVVHLRRRVPCLTVKLVLIPMDQVLEVLEVLVVFFLLAVIDRGFCPQ